MSVDLTGIGDRLHLNELPALRGPDGEAATEELSLRGFTMAAIKTSATLGQADAEYRVHSEHSRRYLFGVRN